MNDRPDSWYRRRDRRVNSPDGVNCAKSDVAISGSMRQRDLLVALGHLLNVSDNEINQRGVAIVNSEVICVMRSSRSVRKPLDWNPRNTYLGSDLN